jgi:glycosyltransferase involved in cell wall biosynthesis
MCRKICICSKSSKDSIPKLFSFFLRNKSQTIVNGFDHQRIDNIEFKKINNIHFDKNSAVKIVYVGVLNNVKNQIALLEVLKTTQINSEIIFIGDGENKKALIDFSKNIPQYVKIRFKGLVSREETIEHMLEADISVSLSKGEGMPIAALESLYSGCYMILSNIPPHLELTLPTDRHFLIELSNKSQIRDSLLYVEKNIKEIKCHRKKSKDHAISNFSIKKMLQLYMNVYQDVYKENKKLFNNS